ncbi:hypothetical protein [Corynebacterium urealyticum]|uniref:hypothetical protein n=1 Tax=Corynebacterium urealyticum TaxID=43771 RepID=UPI0039A5265C
MIHRAQNEDVQLVRPAVHQRTIRRGSTRRAGAAGTAWSGTWLAPTGVLVLHILSYLIGSGIAAFVPVVVGMIVDGLVGEEKFNAWWLFAVLVGIFIIQFIGEATGDGLATASVRRVTHNAQQHLSSGVLRRGAGAMSPAPYSTPSTRTRTPSAATASCCRFRSWPSATRSARWWRCGRSPRGSHWPSRPAR